MSTTDVATCPLIPCPQGEDVGSCADAADCPHPIHWPDRDPERPYFPDVEVEMSGRDGGPLMIVGRVARALKAAGHGERVASAFRRDATSGDYDHLIETCRRWVTVS